MRERALERGLDGRERLGRWKWEVWRARARKEPRQRARARKEIGKWKNLEREDLRDLREVSMVVWFL